jgi:hypothetical protein
MTDYEGLEGAVGDWRERFVRTVPYPHLVIDDLFDAELIATAPIAPSKPSQVATTFADRHADETAGHSGVVCLLQEV